MEDLLRATTTAYTDDEILSLSMAAGVQWRRAMPTVDLQDRDELARALVRGYRSLALRDIHDGLVEGDPMPVLVADRDPRWVVAPVDNKLMVEELAQRIEFYDLPSGTVEGMVLPNGTHLFSHWPDASPEERVAATLAEGDAEPPLALMAVGPLGPDGRPAVVKGAECQLIRLGQARTERTPLDPPSTSTGWLAVLVDIIG